MTGETFIITKDWINSNKTAKGKAWNDSQLRAIGLRFPPNRGWIASVVGKEITLAAKASFEGGTKKVKSNTDKLVATFKTLSKAQQLELAKRLMDIAVNG